MTNYADIIDIIATFKRNFENCITTHTFNGQSYSDGQKAKEALIRSQDLINLLHDYVKKRLILNQVDPDLIFPKFLQHNPEVKLSGALKEKDQDIFVINKPAENINNLNLDNVSNSLCINVRSQLSSLAKNFDTLYERTFAEALNLHLKYPSLCMGELYLIPVYEYDEQAMLQNRILFKERCANIENYVQKFQLLNKRTDINSEEYKYERVCLLIVDFNRSIPKIYNTVDELISDGLIPEDSTVSMENLSIENFVEDILENYKTRSNFANISLED